MKLTLTVLHCPDSAQPQMRAVAGGKFSIGRGPENDWALPDPERFLSKRHCILAYCSGRWQIADLSTNGTFLNRETEPIGRSQPRDLRDGDRLRLGAYEIGLFITEAAPPHHSGPASASDSPETARAGDVPNDEILAAFLRGARLPDARPSNPVAVVEALGAAFRAIVSGLRLALIARAAIQSEFSIEQTMIRSRGNNPLKFSADDDDALLALLGAGRRTEMGATEAVADALRDMRLHEVATVAAMRSAVAALVAQFEPAKLRLAAEQGGLNLVPVRRKARAWDAFEALYTQTSQALIDDFDAVFGKAFARAYERALDEASAREPAPSPSPIVPPAGPAAGSWRRGPVGGEHPFALDPFEPRPAPAGGPLDQDPVSWARFGQDPLISEPVPAPTKLAPDYDPLAQEPDEPTFAGPSEPDHSPHHEDAFRHDRVHPVLPEDWDRKPAAQPAAPAAAPESLPGASPASPADLRQVATGTAAADNQDRVIDANLLGERFAPGETATLTIVVRLPSSRPHGKWQEMLKLDPERGPMRVILEAQGFTILSEPPPPFDLPANRDTAPVAFELRIEEASRRWLHIVIAQEGRPVGELTINDFSAMGGGFAQGVAGSRIRSVAEADLMLVVRAAEGRIEACSPRDRASLDHVTMMGFKYPATPFRDLLANRLRVLYDDRSDPEETARELQIVGVELAACLPVDLVKLLRRPDIRSVMLRHEDDFDFPLELCYLDHPDDPFFVGDRIAICRWYLGVTSLPDIVSKRVRKVAFLKGCAEAFTADEALLNKIYPNRTVTFTRRSEVVEKLFKTSDFDLIHFTGHCRQQDKTSGGLELADGSFLRLIEIGQLESERSFAAAQPFVMLNACASVRPYLGLTHHGSFAHRFVTSHACAVVGTLWPVAGAVANEFAQRFYVELASDKPIGQALLAAKLALVHENYGNNSSSPNQVPALRQLARQVAVRSYCLFANPDLRLVA